MSTPMAAAPFTQAVVAAMRKLYPEALADRSFDNTGLLLEAPFDAQRQQKNSVLLTIDLTKAVADEAIRRKDSCIIAYHPIIFRGLKSLTLKDTQQQSLLRLAAEGISVYSPHTAIDAAPGGLGDWLADIVSGEPTRDTSLTEEQNSDQSVLKTSSSEDKPSTVITRPSYTLQHHPSQLSIHENALDLGSTKHERYPIKKVSVNGQNGAGMGRIVRLSSAVPLTEIVDRIGLGLGNPKGFPIAVPQDKVASEMMIKSIAICAGSGGHLFSEMEKDGEDVDLLFTGELSHHEALAAIEKGKCVITLFHSNTERGFLHSVLQPQLEDEIKEQWNQIRRDDETPDGASEDEPFEVYVSEVDRDPYGIMVLKQ